jgi:peptidyl-prolyl cis-trans isomerase A (cyclophilin A)
MAMVKAFIAALFLLFPAHLGAANPQVELKTSMGAIVVELYPERAPATVRNFLQYVEDGFYNGTIFHRVIDGFMIQGGGFTADLAPKKTRDPIPIESNNGLRNEAGTIAMARTRDPNSATSQFFINVVNNDMLNYPNPDGHGYTVFGKVVKGMEVVQRIAKVRTATRPPHQNVPVQPVVIESVRVLDTSAGKPAK